MGSKNEKGTHRLGQLTGKWHGTFFMNGQHQESHGPVVVQQRVVARSVELSDEDVYARAGVGDGSTGYFDFTPAVVLDTEETIRQFDPDLGRMRVVERTLLGQEPDFGYQPTSSFRRSDEVTIPSDLIIGVEQPIFTGIEIGLSQEVGGYQPIQIDQPTIDTSITIPDFSGIKIRID